MAGTCSATEVNKISTPLLLVVAAALVRPDGHVLLQRRPAGKAHAGLWEFPGGKVEPGETPELALMRELAEELGIAVAPETLIPAAFAGSPAGERHLLLLLYVVHDWAGEPHPLEAATLAWTLPADMAALPMPPADYPLARQLVALLRVGRP